MVQTKQVKHTLDYPVKISGGVLLKLDPIKVDAIALTEEPH